MKRIDLFFKKGENVNYENLELIPMNDLIENNKFKQSIHITITNARLKKIKPIDISKNRMLNEY